MVRWISSPESSPKPFAARLCGDPFAHAGTGRALAAARPTALVIIRRRERCGNIRSIVQEQQLGSGTHKSSGNGACLAFALRSNLAPVTSPLPLPALHASHGGTWLKSADGATRAISKGDAIMAAADTPVLLINAPLVASRLGYPDLSGLDLLELFAFIHPARFCVPTPKGLAHALGLDEPASDDAVPA